MKSIDLQINLLSETIFGSGSATSGEVDLEILYDEIGLPYLKGKTLKGKLREEAENLYALTQSEWLKQKLQVLFGERGEGYGGALNFSDCEVDKEIKAYLLQGLKEQLFTKEEILGALTDTRQFISIGEDGIAQDKALRQMRVINRGLQLVCCIYKEDGLDQEILAILAAASSSLRYLGALESRGNLDSRRNYNVVGGSTSISI